MATQLLLPLSLPPSLCSPLELQQRLVSKAEGIKNEAVSCSASVTLKQAKKMQAFLAQRGFLKAGQCWLKTDLTDSHTGSAPACYPFISRGFPTYFVPNTPHSQSIFEAPPTHPCEKCSGYAKCLIPSAPRRTSAMPTPQRTPFAILQQTATPVLSWF